MQSPTESSATRTSTVLEISSRLTNVANVTGAALVLWWFVYVSVRNQAWISGVLIMLGFSLTLTMGLPAMIIACAMVLYRYDAVGSWLPMSSCISAVLSLAIDRMRDFSLQRDLNRRAARSVPAPAPDSFSIAEGTDRRDRQRQIEGGLVDPTDSVGLRLPERESTPRLQSSPLQPIV